MMDLETQFLSGLIELQYGQPVEKKLAKIAKKVSWAKGWPGNKTSFWNAEAFMWSYKIDQRKRAVIQQELSALCHGKNLDLGCGAYSYIPSTGLDISPKMIEFNENCTSKIIADLEQPLPVPDTSFHSVTMIFLLNYIKNYRQLLSEVQRILKNKGRLVLVFSAVGVQDWHQQKELTKLSPPAWSKILQEQGFRVMFHEKEGIWFFTGVKMGK
ncbi:class I SAM-dependent methyltransferase [Candidatus Woesearchaeota archaeon]|nr:class I SAM-dependent methyltransferase [Candidatus Woesearchaeota archaeon]